MSNPLVDSEEIDGKHLSRLPGIQYLGNLLTNTRIYLISTHFHKKIFKNASRLQLESFLNIYSCTQVKKLTKLTKVTKVSSESPGPMKNRSRRAPLPRLRINSSKFFRLQATLYAYICSLVCYSPKHKASLFHIIKTGLKLNLCLY